MAVPDGLAARQGSLFGLHEPSVDASFVDAGRVLLDDRSWIEVVRGWSQGADAVFDELVQSLPLRPRTDVKMFDRLVDEPRLSAWWHVDGGLPEPMSVLADMRELLSTRYGEEFHSIGDLFVMGGACQHDWEHTAPKARNVGPRLSITFRNV